MPKKKSRKIYRNPCPRDQADQIYTTPRGGRRRRAGRGIGRTLGLAGLAMLSFVQPELIPFTLPISLAVLGGKKRRK